jgi:acetylornithine deacetylase
MGPAAHSDPAVRLLADLVRIPSINPMGRACSGPQYTEAAIGAYVESFLRRHGIDVQVSESAPGRPNVVGYVDAGASRTLLLEAHLDTVHAEGMTVEPFGAEIVDGALYGRGACDTKASLAAFLHALTTVLQHPGRLAYNVIIAAIADEEYRFTGAIHALKSGLRADCGIAGEPTMLHIVRAHKGVVRWHVRTTGRAAHAAYPDRGENAIYRMGRVLERLEHHARELQARTPHPSLGTPTLSVGMIEGGQAVNIVPDHCRIEIDRRTLPGERADDAIRAVSDLLGECEGCEIEDPYLAVSGMDVPGDALIVQSLARAIRPVAGEPVIEGAHYATDAGLYTSAGIPTVVFGPGNIADAHTAAEHVALQELHAAVTIIQNLLTTPAP